MESWFRGVAAPCSLACGFDTRSVGWRRAVPKDGEATDVRLEMSVWPVTFRVSPIEGRPEPENHDGRRGPRDGAAEGSGEGSRSADAAGEGGLVSIPVGLGEDGDTGLVCIIRSLAIWAGLCGEVGVLEYAGSGPRRCSSVHGSRGFRMPDLMRFWAAPTIRAGRVDGVEGGVEDGEGRLRGRRVDAEVDGAGVDAEGGGGQVRRGRR